MRGFSFSVVYVSLGKLRSEYAYLTPVFPGYHIMIPQILKDD